MLIAVWRPKKNIFVTLKFRPDSRYFMVFFSFNIIYKVKLVQLNKMYHNSSTLTFVEQILFFKLILLKGG